MALVLIPFFIGEDQVDLGIGELHSAQARAIGQHHAYGFIDFSIGNGFSD